MLQSEPTKLAEQVGTAILCSRDEVKRFLDEAEASGDVKTARRWATELRKWDSHIAKYGLTKYAHRT